MSDIRFEKLLPPLLSGQTLIEKIASYPSYDERIRNAQQHVRLEALTDLYRFYYPFPMVIEIYNKLYLATSLALKKKNTKLVLKQRNDTYRAMMGDRQYHGIIGGADSFTVIGKSGTGKTSAIMAAINLITDQKVIEVENPFQKIIPCIKVECPFDASAKGLILEILRSVDEIIGTEYYERSRKTSDTTDILIGTISQVALNHIGLLVIDEIQNVWGRKNGTTLISMITQLINSSGISIAMVGTEECIPFFEKGAQLARRAQGLKYNSLLYDEYYAQFCRSIWKYQYTKELIPIEDSIIEWIYEHSAGVIANNISLVHDAQEIAILEGYEKLDLHSLNMAYKTRMGFMHRFIETSTRKVKTKKKDIEGEAFEEKDIDSYCSIEDMVKTARNRSINILDYLRNHIIVEEVNAE